MSVTAIPATPAMPTDLASVSATIRSLLLQARRALTGEPAVAERCIEGAVCLLPELDSPIRDAPASLILAKGGLAPWQMLRVSALIEERLSDRLSGPELAATARLSTSHFGRAFKRSFGESPQVYVNRRRIARAKVLMMETGRSLTDIALSCGLADQAHFCRLFQRFERQTPSGWRRIHAGGGTAS